MSRHGKTGNGDMVNVSSVYRGRRISDPASQPSIHPFPRELLNTKQSTLLIIKKQIQNGDDAAAATLPLTNHLDYSRVLYLLLL